MAKSKSVDDIVSAYENLSDQDKDALIEKIGYSRPLCERMKLFKDMVILGTVQDKVSWLVINMAESQVIGLMEILKAVLLNKHAETKVEETKTNV